MKLTIFYIIACVVLAFYAFVSVPRYGCFQGVCMDFHTPNLSVLPYFCCALVFGVISLKRLLLMTELPQVNDYSSKDLSHVDVMSNL